MAKKVMGTKSGLQFETVNKLLLMLTTDNYSL